jgi:lipopolysaccharide/colanic/teichoic acid biosynthesis glycosyltransferase
VLNNLAGRDLAAYDQLKRPLDFACALVLLIPAVPIMVATALAVWLSSRGPVLYRQERVGRGGQPFQIIKFRTMRADAEKSGAVFAAKDDARITGVGRCRSSGISCAAT